VKIWICRKKGKGKGKGRKATRGNSEEREAVQSEKEMAEPT
jgi:hypothetical protein